MVGSVRLRGMAFAEGFEDDVVGSKPPRRPVRWTWVDRSGSAAGSTTAAALVPC
jgi:hypothetical protein